MRTPPHFFKRLLIVSSITTATCLEMRAASFTWSGAAGGGDLDWTTGSNWVANNPPDNNGTATILFSGSVSPSSYSSYVDTAYNISRLEFNASSSAGFTVSGAALTFTGATSSVMYFSGANAVTNTISNNIVLNTPLLQMTSGTDSTRKLILSGNISGTGGIAKAFTFDTLRLTGNNTFEGGIQVNRGTLEIGSNTALGTGALALSTANSAGITAYGGARSLTNALKLGGLETGQTSSTVVTGNLTLGGTVTIDATSALKSYAKYLFLADGSALTLNGNIVQSLTGGATAGHFRVTGANATAQGGGTLILNGDGSYTGATTIGSGSDATAGYIKAYVNGDLKSSSATNVYNGSTLAGTGTVRNLTVRSSGKVDAGGASGTGTLHVEGTASFLSNSTLLFTLDTAGTSDRLEVTGAINIEGGTTLSLTSTGVLSDRYTLLTFAETLVPYGTFTTILLNGSETNWTNSGYSINYGTTSITIIPEPSIVLLSTTGLALMLIYRKRKVIQ